MTPPLVSLNKINKEENNEQENHNENVSDDDLRQKLNNSENNLNKIKYKNYSYENHNDMRVCTGLMLFLSFTISVIILGYDIYRILNLEIFNTREKELKSIHNYTDFLINSLQCQLVPKASRIDCHPENGASESTCTARGCCWDPISNKPSIEIKNNPLGISYCYYPTDWKLYEYKNISQKGGDSEAFLQKNNVTSFYKNDLPSLKMESTTIDESILRVKIYDPNNPRYEPLFPLRDDPKPFSKNIKNPKYGFNIDDSKPGFKISRVAGKDVIFDSITTGGFIFADQFLQMSTLLPSTNIYGLGEHRTSLKLNTNWQTLTMFNKDQPPMENVNLYGSHPFYLIIEESGDCHGVLLLNSNAMDIILQPTPALTYRTIGGIFDFYFLMGPTPAEVLQQYSQIVSKPFLPPYWSLGFHLCRFGYRTLNKTIEVWNRTRNAGIPFDTQWNDLDYMDNNNDFTFNNNTFKDLPTFVDQLHELGMHYIPLIDPGISASEINGSYPPYDDGLRSSIFIKDDNTSLPFIGKVWNRVSTVWPDFTHIHSGDYWYTMMKKMHDYFKYDGAWLDMNEPSNFYNGRSNGCEKNDLDYPPYLPNVVGNLLSTKTLCMNAKHYLGWHYNIHNVYATFEADKTYYALKTIQKDKRVFILSRGTWIGQGYYTAHWTGDIYSTWYDLKMSVSDILAFSLFQIPMVGTDICGFNGNTTESLCNRWMQLGAFYPFSRNHNSDDTIEQDPVAMGDLVVKSSIKALTIRYRFLPYLYTLLYRAHLFGDTVARPMFIDFIDDRATWNIDTQFLWGSAFMIVPVLDENKTEVVAYIPRGIWYNYYTKDLISSKGENFTLNAPLDIIPIVIRGGFILPGQKPGKTTTESRKNDFELLIAPDESGRAVGELYWDDGENIDPMKDKQYRKFQFKLQNQTIIIENIEGQFKMDKGFTSMEVMGVRNDVKWVTVNDKSGDFKYDKKESCLKVSSIAWNLTGTLIVKWG